MKKTFFVIAGLLSLLLCSCNIKEQNSMEIKNNNTVTFINGAKDADVWILPKTEKNLKTTVWGTATASKVKTGESRQTQLCEPGDDGLYIFRMIDTESFYYSANGIALEDGWSLEIKETEQNIYALDVRDGNGELNKSYEVFSARL